MRFLGVGVDLVSLRRITDLVNRRGIDPLARRILSKREIDLLADIEDKVAFVQTRFAVKEALFKAVSPYKRLLWSEVSITKRENGRPNVQFEREPNLVADVSISHDDGFLVAMAIAHLKN